MAVCLHARWDKFGGAFNGRSGYRPICPHTCLRANPAADQAGHEIKPVTGQIRRF